MRLECGVVTTASGDVDDIEADC